MRIHLGFLVVLFVLVFSACNDELFINKNNQNSEISDQSLGFDVKVKNNTLYFTDADAAFKAMEVLLRLDSEKRINWEQKIGFVSARTELEMLREQIAEIDNLHEIDKLIDQNTNFIIKSDNENSGIDTRIYGNYSLITGRNGILYYADFVSRILDKTIYTTTSNDISGITALSELTSNKDISGTLIELLPLEYTDSPELKSLFAEGNINDERLELFMGDKSEGQWEKRAYYQLFFNNTTLAHSITHTEYTYYLVVSLYCTNCNINAFTYYNNEKRKWLKFENIIINGDPTDSWRIEVPNRGYKPNWYFNPPPIWPSSSEMYINEPVRTYYQYFMKIGLVHKIQAQWYRNINKTWQPHKNTIIQALNVKVQAQIGHNNQEHSSGILLDNLYRQELNPNGTEGVAWDSFNTPLIIYNGYISRYTESNPPIARFKGCVEGKLTARFCPQDRFFNYNF